MIRPTLLALAFLGMASAALAQGNSVHATLGPPPGVEFGEWLSIDFRTKLQVDFRRYSPEVDIGAGHAVFRRARVGIEGRAFRDVDYEVQVELRDDEQPWRDVYANYGRFGAAEITGGRFKMPFGRDELTSVFRISFVERALVTDALVPGRDEGVMVHGRIAGRVLEYQTGVFRHDGDNASDGQNPGAGATWVGRAVWAPWGHDSGPLRDLQAGGGVTVGEVPEGLNGLGGSTHAGYVFSEPVFVRGRRVRVGVDGSWTAGPGQMIAEYIRVADERIGQGIDDGDLPAMVGQGWYVSGSWVLSGEKKGADVEPRRPLGRGGAGAFEAAARLEALWFGSGSADGEPAYANPRAARLLPNRDTLLTLGLNWYLNRLGRVTVNARRDHLSDAERTPQPGRQTYWGAVLRLQFVL